MNTNKIAIVTGANGQVGSYMVDFLLEKLYFVVAVVRRNSSNNTHNLTDALNSKYKKNLKIVSGDLTDYFFVDTLIKKYRPNEIYNYAAQSFVGSSFNEPIYTANNTAINVLNLLHSLKNNNLVKKCKFFQASTSEQFGKVKKIPQNEETPFYPRSPYGCSKLFAHWSVINFRESYDAFACCAISFNHESPRRSRHFVTRKISFGLSELIKGISKESIKLGNISSKRDWGHAKDYVHAHYLMIQSKNPCDYVVSTGNTSSVKDFINISLNTLGIIPQWKGTGLKEKMFVKNIVESKYQELVKKNIKIGQNLFQIHKDFYRPAEVDFLLGDSRKIIKELKWKYQSSLEDIVKDMIEFDVRN